MRFFIIAAILLAFPALEIWFLIDLAQKYGWLLLVYLVKLLMIMLLCHLPSSWSVLC